MTVKDLAVLARGIAPMLHALSLRLSAVEVKERGLDGAVGPRGLDGQTGPAGRDGLPGRDGLRGEPGADGLDGRHGADGLGFDDLTVLHDGERAVTLRFQRGDHVREFTITIPSLIYRDVYVEGKSYTRGDVVTWAGSTWHANEPTSTKPGDGTKAWTLVVKRGRDGKDAPTAGAAGPAPIVNAVSTRRLT